MRIQENKKTDFFHAVLTFATFYVLFRPVFPRSAIFIAQTRHKKAVPPVVNAHARAAPPVRDYVGENTSPTGWVTPQSGQTCCPTAGARNGIARPPL